MIGTVLCNRYRILDEIGSGNMGVVYRAWDERLGKTVALKVLPRDELQDAKARARFKETALLLAPINHPNICAVYDFDTCDGIDCLVLEHVPGATLEKRITSGPLAEDEVIRLGKQLAEGLAAAHDLGVIHRDLKPGNVSITPNGLLKIFDFGLARFFSSKAVRITTSESTEFGYVRGTPSYMSPEAYSGADSDLRRDIWAAGVVLFQMATGRLPFPQTNLAELYYAIQNTPTPSPRTLRPGLSRKLERIILKALEKDPTERYQSARELSADLDRVDEAPGPVPRWLVASAALIPLVVLVVGYVSDFRGFREWTGRLIHGEVPHRAAIAIIPFEHHSTDPTQADFAAVMTGELNSVFAQIGALDVIAQPAVDALWAREKSLPKLKEKLHVDAFVTGTVAIADGQVRILASITGPPDWTVRWSQTYDRALRDVLALQAGVAHDIVRQIRVRLTPGEQARLAAAPPVNSEAYQLYLEGRQRMGRRDGLPQAAELLRKATALDSTFAPAYAGLADAYYRLAIDRLVSREEAVPAAKRAAKRALALDRDLAEAYSVLGAVHEDFEWNWAAAERVFKRALELSPGDATAHQRYADHLAALGRFDDAIEHIERAVRLDPVTENAVIMNQEYGSILMAQHKYAAAIGRLRQAIDLDPPASLLSTIYSVLGLAYWKADSAAKALEALEQSWRLGGVPEEAVATLQSAYAQDGMAGVWRLQLEQLGGQDGSGGAAAYQRAALSALVGRREEALKWLRMACKRRDPFLVGLNVDPRFDDYRSDPRFRSILACVGLPGR